MKSVKPTIALDIGPMSERHHTGIANVAKNLAREMLSDSSIEAKFFMLRGEVPRAVVEKLVELTTGDILWWLAGRLNARPSIDLNDQPIIGIFTAIKRHRRLFPFEVQIVHDLTTVVTPQYHTSDSVALWQHHLLGDILSSDLVVTVSEATRRDMHDFFPASRNIPSLVAHLASSVRITERSDKRQQFVLVLGTLEPRKNARLILECLANYPELFSPSRTFVFTGRWGWGEGVDRLVKDLGLARYKDDGRLVFTGFVEDETRDQLITNASLVVYPSRYEGFGLPIIEALSLGIPVLTSYAASLPEVGGDVAYYCDIDSPVALRDTLNAILSKQLDPNAQEKVRHQCLEWAKQFSWNKTYRTIRDAALELAKTS